MEPHQVPCQADAMAARADVWPSRKIFRLGAGQQLWQSIGQHHLAAESSSQPGLPNKLDKTFTELEKRLASDWIEKSPGFT